jgi:hypothetical protein
MGRTPLPQGTHPADPAEARKLIAEAVRRIVREEIALPESPSDTHQTSTAESHAARYFRENRPRTNFAIAWKLFRDAVGSGRIRPPSILVSDFEADVREAWSIRDDAADKASASGTARPSDLENWVNQRLRAHFAWPDKRGDLYADAYRSGYVLTYLLSAMAVLVALLPMAAGFEGQARTICVVTEFAMLVVILLLFVIGRKRQWYERWMEYRLLAEMIRQLRVLIPLGGGRPLPRTPTHLGLYGSLTQTWMYWHTRAIARATGIPQAKVKPEYLLDCLSYIDELVGRTKEGQFQFQKDTEIRTEHIAHRLHKTSTYLFGITFSALVLIYCLKSPDPARSRIGWNFTFRKPFTKHWINGWFWPPHFFRPWPPRSLALTTKASSRGSPNALQPWRIHSAGLRCGLLPCDRPTRTAPTL